MPNKKIKGFGSVLIALAPLAIIIFLTGCIKFSGSPDSGGGVFKSQDRGETWEQKVFVAKTDKKLITINQANVLAMASDPFEPKTIYIGTQENGMYVTNDEGESWRSILLDRGQISKIAVDPKDGKIIYAARHNQIFKSLDRGKNWDLIYVESQPNQLITDLAIDSYDPQKIYAGLSGGKLIRSTNRGQSWSIVKDFENRVEKILINEKDTRIIYLATQHAGLFQTTDLGKNWKNLQETLGKYSGSHIYQAAVLDPTKKNSILYISNFGMLKSDDGGKEWKEIKLLVSPTQMKIYTLAVNPKNNKEIYYGTASALYKTTDGGESWVTKPLPTTRTANYLLINHANPKIIYFGVLKTGK